MGEARNKGETHEERREAALDREMDRAEVLIALREDDGGIGMSILPRDEEMNGQSLAIILATFIHSNLEALTKAAVQAKLASEQPQGVVVERAKRSLTTAEGALAVDASIVGPDGRPLQ